MLRSGSVQPCSFQIQTLPRPEDLGWAFERRLTQVNAFVEFHFGDDIAVQSISDIWHMSCELVLQAELVREKHLYRFLMDAQQLFAIEYDVDDMVLCTWSAERIFAVPLNTFASSLELLVEELVASTRYPKLTRIRVDSAAVMIRAQPYLSQFTQRGLQTAIETKRRYFDGAN
jgi:hypothetical protein